MRPHGCECEDENPRFAPELAVHEDKDWIDTDLLDANGEPLLQTEKRPMGFDLSSAKPPG